MGVVYYSRVPRPNPFAIPYRWAVAIPIRWAFSVISLSGSCALVFPSFRSFSPLICSRATSFLTSRTRIFGENAEWKVRARVYVIAHEPFLDIKGFLLEA